MRVSVGLPTHLVDDPVCTSVQGIGMLARAAEDAGADAVFVTEHPFPRARWPAHGGHHALDPMVALTAAAAATRHVRLHTNVLVLAYRNPFLTAKAVASLDVASGGRVICGVAAGYLEGEFAALGASFADRNDRVDDALDAVRAAWTGEPVTRQGPGYSAGGDVMRPVPVQRPHPPLWVGGNSRRALRRAVERGDGWMPFPTAPRVASVLRTGALETVADLEARLAEAGEHAASVGRVAPLDVCMVPFALGGAGAARPFDPPALVDEAHALAALGVTWLTLPLPAVDDAAAAMLAIERLAADVIPGLPNRSEPASIVGRDQRPHAPHPSH